MELPSRDCDLISLSLGQRLSKGGPCRGAWTTDFSVAMETSRLFSRANEISGPAPVNNKTFHSSLANTPS